MFLIVFKALFTEFCNCACAKKIVMLIRIRHTCAALLHKKTVLSLKTSSEINFEFIKFVKKGKCLPLIIYKYNILERVLVENIIPRNVIINRGEAEVEECYIYFIIPNIIPLFSYHGARVPKTTQLRAQLRNCYE